jgi:hypothetical protein
MMACEGFKGHNRGLTEALFRNLEGRKEENWEESHTDLSVYID